MLVCFWRSAQNGFHEQETVRMKERKVLPSFSFNPSCVFRWVESVCACVCVCESERLTCREAASLFPIPHPPLALFCPRLGRKWGDWHGLQPIGREKSPPPFSISILVTQCPPHSRQWSTGCGSGFILQMPPPLLPRFPSSVLPHEPLPVSPRDPFLYCSRESYLLQAVPTCIKK